jgi:peroxiredoxin
MPSLDWQLIAEIASTVSTIAFAVSAIVVVLQLRQAARERYFSVTSHLFEIWQSPEFQHDQLFLLHKLRNPNWEDFCALGRGEHAERAIHRVGGYYDRVGNLVRHSLIRKDDILPTIGGYAVAVWYRIEPLVKELRLRENAVLFDNYEALLPECRGCYVPGIDGHTGIVATPSVPATNRSSGAKGLTPPETAKTTTSTNGLKQRSDTSNQSLAGGVKEVAVEKTTNGVSLGTSELSLPDTDGVVRSLSEFMVSGPAVVVYARGAWCPYCLRQLSDYREHYRGFKESGVEVVAVSPESPRRSRRMRTGLKLPFAVLSDARLEFAKHLGLMGHEKPGEPTPATLVLDRQGVKLSTLNQREKSLLAQDVLDYVRVSMRTVPAAPVPTPQVAKPRPGFLFAQALMNIVAGLVIR